MSDQIVTGMAEPQQALEMLPVKEQLPPMDQAALGAVPRSKK